MECAADKIIFKILLEFCKCLHLAGSGYTDKWVGNVLLIDKALSLGVDPEINQSCIWHCKRKASKIYDYILISISQKQEKLDIF